MQQKLAQRMSIAQPTLSRLEKQTDMQVNTHTKKLVDTLSGELEIVARFPKGGMSIRQFNEDGGKSKRCVRKLQLV